MLGFVAYSQIALFVIWLAWSYKLTLGKINEIRDQRNEEDGVEKDFWLIIAPPPLSQIVLSEPKKKIIS